MGVCLRSINRKLLGLILTIISITIIFFLPIINKIKFINNKYFLIKKIEIFILIIVITLISFIGSKPSKHPHILIAKFLTIIYFLILKFILIQNY